MTGLTFQELILKAREPMRLLPIGNPVRAKMGTPEDLRPRTR
jgi:hypothetical protein